MSERFITTGIMPTPFEQELVTIFIEECLEAGIRVTKLLRFGLDEVQPEQELTNRQRLAHEIGDVMTMVSLLIDWEIVLDNDVEAGMNQKRQQLNKYFQHMPEGGLWQKEG